MRLPLPALEPDTEPFWRAAHAGRLEITRCRTDGLVHPSAPARVCPRCRGKDVAFVPVSGRATLASFTVNAQRWMPGIDVPYVIGLVELVEQAGLRLTTNIVGCPPEQLRIGMPLRVTFKQVSDEVGLPLFEPDPEADRVARAGLTVPSDRPGHPARRGPAARAARHPLGRRPVADRPAPLPHRPGSHLRRGARGHRRRRPHAGGNRRPRLLPGSMGAAAPGFSGPGTPEVQDALGLQLGWHGSGGEGPAQVAPVMLAALAVAAGLCRHALVYRTVTEATASASTGRQGIGSGARTVSGFAQWVIPYGAMSAANWLALHAVRHMHEFGTRREHFGEIALTARAHAALNPAAIYREPMTMENYLGARMITWPFGLYDCDVPVDGSTAVIVSAADAARDLPPAVRIHAIGSAIRGRPVWDQWEIDHHGGARRRRADVGTRRPAPSTSTPSSSTTASAG